MEDLTGTGSPTPSPDAPSAPAPAAAIPAAPAGPPTSAPAPPHESRENWVPPHRLREATEQHRAQQQQWMQQDAQYKAQLAQLQRQRDALAGITPPEDPDSAQVKQQFAQLFPTLARLEERGIDPEQIASFLQRANDIEAQQSHYWQSYGRQTMDRLFEKASSTLGAPLTDQAKGALHAAFTGYVQSSPELVQRYASDPSLIEEFWNAFSSSFIEPARRVASAGMADRAGVPIPRDTSGGIRVTPAPAMQNMDERLSTGWNQYLQTAKPK